MFNRPHEKEFAKMLDELYQLEGLNCNPLSILLRRGDPAAYEIGFDEWLDENYPDDEDA